MIGSVLNQTFQDFEIIIVNDGSTDNTREILDEINNEKIRVIHSEHKGPSHARNVAISNSRSEIIFNLDADDKIAENLFEIAYLIFQAQPNVGIVYSETRFFGSRNGIMRLGEFNPERMLKSNQIVSAAFFRKEDWHRCGGYSEECEYGLEDWDLWLSIIELGREVVKIPETLVSIRSIQSMKDSRSGLRKSERLKSLGSVDLVFKRHQELYSLHPKIYGTLNHEIEKRKKEGHMERLLRNRIFNIKQRINIIVNCF